MSIYIDFVKYDRHTFEIANELNNICFKISRENGLNRQLRSIQGAYTSPDMK